MKAKKDNSAEVESAVARYRKELEDKLTTKDDVVEVIGGFDSLLNKLVLIFSAGYFYEGKLTGVNANFIELEDAYIVYNPATMSIKDVKNCTRDKLPSKKWNVQIGAVESYGELTG